MIYHAETVLDHDYPARWNYVRIHHKEIYRKTRELVRDRILSSLTERVDFLADRGGSCINNLQFKVGAGQLEATIVFCCVGCPCPFAKFPLFQVGEFVYINSLLL